MTTTKYYFHNGQRVALRRGGVLQYLVSDHLGTTSLVLDADGSLHSEARHYPYGEERWSSGTLPTDYRFIGQRKEAGLGLYHIGARWYDPALGRWLSADTIVPDPNNPQALNRYAYVNNNPLNVIDPSGHYGREVHFDFTYRTTRETAKEHLIKRYGLTTNQAELVAEFLAARVATANQGTDCKACIQDNSAIPGPGQIHWRPLKRAWEEIGEASKGTPEEFGRALHGLQDYYAHNRNGFTGPPAPFGGAFMYLTDVVLYGEKFSWDAFKNSFGWGHLFATVSARDLSDWETPLPGDPDYIDFDNLTESDKYMMNDTEYWILVYIRWYFEEHPDELQWFLENEDWLEEDWG